MTDSDNPFESPAATPIPTPPVLGWHELLTIAIWLLLPIGVFLLQRLTAPLYQDFGTEMPTSTQLFSHLSSVVVLAAGAAIVTLSIVKVPSRKTRLTTTLIALSLGIILTLGIAAAFALPFVSGTKSLT